MNNPLKFATEKKLYEYGPFTRPLIDLVVIAMENDQSKYDDDTSSIYKSFWTLIKHAAKDI